MRSNRSEEPRTTGGRRVSRRDQRLAELVTELSSCDPDDALDAVRSGRGADAADPLEVVARAVTDVRHRPVEPQDRLRVAGFLRPEQRPLPRRNPGRAATAVVERAAAGDEHGLVHHGSLRRWERTGAADADDTATGGPDVAVRDGDVIDLRDRTSRFRRPDPGGEGSGA